MSDRITIEAVTQRLMLALEALNTALERRLEADRGAMQLAEQVHVLGADRSRLAAELDAQTARSRQLEAVNRDIAQRLDLAMENIRAAIAEPEG